MQTQSLARKQGKTHRKLPFLLYYIHLLLAFLSCRVFGCQIKRHINLQDKSTLLLTREGQTQVYRFLSLKADFLVFYHFRSLLPELLIGVLGKDGNPTLIKRSMIFLRPQRGLSLADHLPAVIKISL